MSARKPVLSEADLDSAEAYGMRKAIESKNLLSAVEAGDDDAAHYWTQKMGLESPSQLNVLNQLVLEAIRRKGKK